MPTVLRIDGFRFFFYSSDRTEPVHVHIEKGAATAKVWLKPVRLEHSIGFSNTEIRKIMNIAEEHEELIVRSWNEFFFD